MKLFFKHLFRSIKKRPLQPAILILTLALAVIVTCCTLTVREYMHEENTFSQQAKYGNADFTITLNSESTSRFLFTEKVEEILGDKGKVSGIFELPLFKGEEQKTVFGVATEFEKIGNVFNVAFSEYGSVAKSTKEEVAFISREFAETENLKLGDQFVVNVLGHDKKYTIEGISETPYFSSYDVMVDITGVMRILAKDSLFVSSLGESFKPCSTVYVDLSEGVSVSDAIVLLKENVDFRDKTFDEVTGIISSLSAMDSLEIVIDILILLSVGLSVAVVFCCLYIISTQRTEENELFKIAGAKRWRLNLLQYVEIAIYWMIGAIIGVAMIKPLLNVMVLLIGYKYVMPHVSIISIFSGLGITLISSLLTVTAFVAITGKEKLKEKKINLPLIALIITVLLIITLFVITTKYKIIISILAILFFALFLFLFVPILFKYCMKKLNVILNRNCKIKTSISFRYAVKNVKKVKVLLNTCRLWTLLVAIIVTMLVSIFGATKAIDKNKNYLNGNFAIINATSSCYENLQALDGVESVNKLYFDMCKLDEDNILQIASISSPDVLKEYMDIENLPKGNEAIISKGYADRFKIEIGEELNVKIDEKVINLKVKDIADTVVNILLFDSLNFGIDYSIMIVDGKEEISVTELRQMLSENLALELATIIPISDVFKSRVALAEIYANGAYIILSIVLLFAVIGLIDNLAESYRFRRKEFELYNLSGMSRRAILKMKISEILIVLTFGLTIGLLSSVAILFLLDEAIRAAGLRLLFSFIS